MVDLKAIPSHYKGQNIDLTLIHLGGTTIPSPSLPLLMVTMDAKHGLELVKLICPDLTIPIHYEYVVVALFPSPRILIACMHDYDHDLSAYGLLFTLTNTRHLRQ